MPCFPCPHFYPYQKSIFIVFLMSRKCFGIYSPFLFTSSFALSFWFSFQIYFNREYSRDQRFDFSDTSDGMGQLWIYWLTWPLNIILIWCCLARVTFETVLWCQILWQKLSNKMLSNKLSNINCCLSKYLQNIPSSLNLIYSHIPSSIHIHYFLWLLNSTHFKPTSSSYLIT